MHIIDEAKWISINNVLLVLDMDEIKELSDSLIQIIEKNGLVGHEHISDAASRKEITIYPIRDGDLSHLHPDLKEIIAKEL